MMVDGPETIETHPRGPCCAWRKGVACWAAMTWRASSGRYFDFAMQSRPRRRRKKADDRRCGTEIEAAICRRSSVRPDQSSSCWAHSRQSERQPRHGRCRHLACLWTKAFRLTRRKAFGSCWPLNLCRSVRPFARTFRCSRSCVMDPGRYGRRPTSTPMCTSSNCAIRLLRRTRQHGLGQVRRAAHPWCGKACPI
jgi:hypothetical protein